MARFRVYRLKSESVLAIDLQTNMLDDLPSRVMASLSGRGHVLVNLPAQSPFSD